MLTFEQIKELIDLVCERELQGLEIERSGFRVKIHGKESVQHTSIVQAVASDQSVAQPAVPHQPIAGVIAAATDGVKEISLAEEAEKDGVHLLNSPIVGTFYTAPNPDADSYATVGDRVKRGQVLCIIEAMKLMNEIESDEDGVVERIFPNNAQPVEFGEPLFAIRPD